VVTCWVLAQALRIPVTSAMVIPEAFLSVVVMARLHFLFQFGNCRVDGAECREQAG